MHANIRNNEIIDFNSMYLDEDITRVETTQEMYELYQQDNKAVIYQDGEIIKNPEWDNIYFEQKKQEKIEENDKNRDEKLNGGVIYNNVLFDSDTDQKVNLIGRISTLNDGDNIVWYGMNNDELLCNKQDLLNIGMIIEEFHTYCWDRNSEIKIQINNAKTIDELNSIDISYEFEGGEYNG